MFILHVKHYFFQEILKVHSLQKRCRVSILLRLLPANYKIFEVPVLVFARASGNAVSAVRPWDRGCDVTERNARKRTSTKRFLACKAGARGLGKSRKLFSNMAEFQNI